jgi:hypothetical protein
MQFTMTRFERCAIASLSVLAACVVKNSQPTDPSAAEYDGYYSEKSGSGGSGGDTTDGSGAPKPSLVTSTTGAPKRKGKSLASKKPPVDGGTKPKPTRPKPPNANEVTLAGFVPSNGGPGTLVEVFGTGFATPKDVAVMFGKKKAKIVDASEGHLVVQVPEGGNGAVSLMSMLKGTAGRPATRTAVKSTAPFGVLAKDSPFAKAGRKDKDHGLIGNVFAIGKEVTELPAFDDLGSPIATIAVDALDIPSSQMKGAFKGAGGDAKEWFAIHFKGSLNVTAAGEYELCVNAGDGAQLYLDENLIVDNDGVHDTKEKCEKLSIEPGEYKVDLLYFQGTGELGLQLSWAKDGAAKEIVPKAALFVPDDRESMASK